MVDVSMHWEDYGLILPPFDTTTYKAATETEGGRELVLKLTGVGYGIGEIGGGGYICHPPRY